MSTYTVEEKKNLISFRLGKEEEKLEKEPGGKRSRTIDQSGEGGKETTSTVPQ